MRRYAFFSVCLLALFLSGCFASGTDSADPVSSGLSYYYGEFPDVAIPNEMAPKSKGTFISYTGDGVKLGTQFVEGRVEIASLVNAMQGYMQRDGWSLRSVFRGPGSILIFERDNRICSVYINEGMLDTSMLIFVSPKLADGVLQYSAPASSMSSAPLSTAPLGSSSQSIDSTSGGNVTVYPAK